MKDEVQTHAFIEKWSRSKRIILPVITGDELELRVYTGPQDLAIGSYGIAEPTGAPFTDYETIDPGCDSGCCFRSVRTSFRPLRKDITTVYYLKFRLPKSAFVSRFN